MCTATKGLAALMLMLLGGLSAVSLTPAQTINIPSDPTAYSIDNEGEDEPEVTARVGRVSFLTGEARIKRIGSDDWERVVLNLPIVEGDEIATDKGARLEIQFDKYQHVRLAENAFLKMVTLRDNAVAVSLSLGSMTVRIRALDKDGSFEIDAPRTTIAIQKAGAYRVDAGREGDSEIRVAATDDGEARVYSENAGFLLRNGRSSRIFIEGARTGEWEMADASTFSDEFGDWSAARDAEIAKRLDSSYYGKYYDDDIYGADDLSSEGEWIDIPGYGNVWRPYASTISRYVDWSPYRYGTWRWMSPYGWIWVNDEPWGWATYHHGRWFYYSGRWLWSPYGYYRPSRSWWYPALVSINFVSNNTCWYPLPYHRPYRRFNNHGGGNGYGGPTPRNGKGGIVQIVRPPVNVVALDRSKPAQVDRVPPGGVVMLDNLQFGTGAKPTRKAPPEVVQQVLSEKLDQLAGRRLPAYKDVSTRIGRDIVAEKPRVLDQVLNSRTGAALRKSDVPLDTELRTKTVFGGRNPRPEVINGATTPVVEGRKQGAFERPVPAREDQPRSTPPVERIERTKPEVTRDPPTRTERPREPEPMRRDKPVPAERPQYVPPMEREKSRPEPPQQRPEPKPGPAPLQRSEPKPSPPPAKDDGGKGKPDKPDKPR